VICVALIFGSLLAFLVVLLAVPLAVEFSVHRIEKTQGVVRFRWLFGLVRFQLRIPEDFKSAKEPLPGSKNKKAKLRKKGTGSGRLFSLVRQRRFRGRVYKFIRDVLRATHARDLFLRLRIGLGDPADTGCLWALVGPVAGLARNLRSATVRIEPEFVDPVLEIESHGRFRLIPIQLIALTAAFLLSPTMLGAWRQLRQGGA
jgi:hypothetical protein